MVCTDLFIDSSAEKLKLKRNVPPSWEDYFYDIADQSTGKICNRVKDGYYCSYCGKRSYWLLDRCEGCGLTMSNSSNSKKENMTFKEKITEKANKYETKDLIKEHIENIKNKIELCYTKRKFVVKLINAHTSMAIGGNADCYAVFIPGYIKPFEYQQLFIDAFNEFGFTDKDMEFVSVSGKTFDEYNIILKW